VIPSVEQPGAQEHEQTQASADGREYTGKGNGAAARGSPGVEPGRSGAGIGGRARAGANGSKVSHEPRVGEIVSIRASDEEPEPVDWVWPGRFPKEMLTLLGGEGGLSKSHVGLALACIQSRGGEWPYSSGRASIGSTLIISAEDHAKFTIIPRIIANGGDRDLIHIITGIILPGRTARDPFTLDEGARRALEHAIAAAKFGDVKLIILDPITSYMGAGVNTWNNAQVRSILDPFGDMAERLNVAVIAITHVAKNKGNTGKNRFIDSVAFVNSARVAYHVEESGHAEKGVTMTATKDNILPKRLPPLTYHPESTTFKNKAGKEIEAPRIIWDAPVNEHPVVNKTPRLNLWGEAREMLQEMLRDGDQPAKNIYAEAERRGISPATLERAKRGLATSYKNKELPGAPWYWRLDPHIRDDDVVVTRTTSS